MDTFVILCWCFLKPDKSNGSWHFGLSTPNLQYLQSSENKKEQTM